MLHYFDRKTMTAIPLRAAHLFSFSHTLS
ncbi:hypothetical protein HDF16_005574 [Granulicella aggregans]|uniref:Uncharacterized protein n=1 Tax=Granulicella aggregans TaxID=474949 RepID=A0A7W7ZJE8_9BACT|nr:hypothetical protein [Granulicella aggregans]